MSDVKVHVPRSYRTAVSDLTPFMGIVNKLSFNCWNIKQSTGTNLQRLSHSGPDGDVEVMRVGDVEYVTITSRGGLSQIILSSSADESFGIPFSLSRCKITGNKKRTNIPATYFGDTYIDPNQDLRAETCPFMFTLDHKRFIIVISGGNTYQPVLTTRDDWHNNIFNNYNLMYLGASWLDYNESITPRYLNFTKYSFSFSPYTWTPSGPVRIGRYIDHAKRLYIPILGRGAAFEEEYTKYSKCEGSPFGKKPFTVVDGVTTTYREVVKIDQLLTYPHVDYTLQIFWPWIAYIHEIPYLNLQYLFAGYFGVTPLSASLVDLGTISSYKMQYNVDEARVEDFALRTDEATGDFPAVVSSHELQDDFAGLNVTHSDPSGTFRQVDTQEQTRSYTIKKSESIGTVGNLKDLFVETDLHGAYTYLYRYENNLTRSSTFPAVYYMAEFAGDTFWPCGNYNDSTSANIKWPIKYTNRISGTQVLKVGDVVIDSGSISMDYEGEEDTEIIRSGSISWSLPCSGINCVAVGYTSQGMQVGETQTMTGLDSEGNPCDTTGCEWQVLSGAGTIDPVTGEYTAPATNASCEGNPVIGLVCNGSPVGTVELAINAIAGVSVAFIYACPPFCVGLYSYISKQPYNCDGTTGSWSECGNCYASDCGVPPGSENCTNYGAVCDPGGCGNYGGITINCSGNTDVRSAAQLLAGCCPAALL